MRIWATTSASTVGLVVWLRVLRENEVEQLNLYCYASKSYFKIFTYLDGEDVALVVSDADDPALPEDPPSAADPALA